MRISSTDKTLIISDQDNKIKGVLQLKYYSIVLASGFDIDVLSAMAFESSALLEVGCKLNGKGEALLVKFIVDESCA